MMRLFFKAVFFFIFSLHNLTAVEEGASGCLVSDNASSKVTNALFYLDQAINLSLTIEEENERSCAYYLFTTLKNDIQSAFQNKDYRTVKEVCMCQDEDIDEILDECSNYKLRVKLASCVRLMMEEIEVLDSERAIKNEVGSQLLRFEEADRKSSEVDFLFTSLDC